MAQLEKFYTQTFAFGNLSPVFNAITLPAIAPGQAFLITSVFVTLDVAYNTNITFLKVVNGGDEYIVYQSAQGSLTANDVTIIPPNSSFVMIEGDALECAISNVGAGNATVTVFYRLIPNQDQAKSVIFGVERGSYVPAGESLTFPAVPANNITFIKSLIIFNDDPTDDYSIDFGGSFIKKLPIVENTTKVILGKDEALFRVSGQDITFTTGAGSGDYYLSYYYDPLYTT